VTSGERGGVHYNDPGRCRLRPVRTSDLVATTVVVMISVSGDSFRGVRARERLLPELRTETQSELRAEATQFSFLRL
jgi:hypothetical protein